MIILICCMSQNRVIGRDGQIPWHFSADIKNFKAKTSGNTILFGRKTFENVGILPNRKTIVLSQTIESGEDNQGVLWIKDPDIVLSLSNKGRDIYICGGQNVYETYLDKSHYLCLTWIHREFYGDTFFPTFDADEWEVILAHRGNRHSYIELKRTF